MERALLFINDNAQEIILRADRPLVIECADARFYLTKNGVLTARYQTEDLLKSDLSDLLSVLKSVCAYSVYSHQNEMNRGYITIKNGVRIGVCGTAVENEKGIVNIKDITTLSFRVASEIIGCCHGVLDKIDPLRGILIFGPPCSGKTTIIRDMARALSYSHKVSVIDGRNEISATFGGCCGFDVGMSDVLVGMNKGVGVIHALRSLSPDVIICDELGDKTDAELLCHTLRCGTAFIATIHAWDYDDLRSRRITSELLRTGAFRYAVCLDNRKHAGRIQEIRDLGDVRD